MHQLNMCCGTMCDKEVNLDYVKRLKLAVDALTRERDVSLIEAKFYRDLYYESMSDIQEHYINIGKEKKSG